MRRGRKRVGGERVEGKEENCGGKGRLENKREGVEEWTRGEGERVAGKRRVRRGEREIGRGEDMRESRGNRKRLERV